VRDEKMLEKLATHDIQDVAELFSLTDKCARDAEGRAWYTPPAPEAGKGAKPDASAATQGGSSIKKKKKKKIGGNNQPLAGAPTAAVTAAVVGGAEVPEATSTPIKRLTAMMERRVVQCTTLRATTLRSAKKSRSSWNSTTSS
jgi:hypothetical protein